MINPSWRFLQWQKKLSGFLDQTQTFFSPVFFGLLSANLDQGIPS